MCIRDSHITNEVLPVPPTVKLPMTITGMVFILLFENKTLLIRFIKKYIIDNGINNIFRIYILSNEYK